MSDELKIWRCPNGHALGVVKRNGKGLHQLLLYRHAVQMDGNPAQVDVMAVVEGSVMDIRCEICGEMRTWVIGQEAMDKLLATWRKMHGNDVFEPQIPQITRKEGRAPDTARKG